MSSYRAYRILACLLMTACVDAPDEEIRALSTQDLIINCGSLRDCQPYETCVSNGTVLCRNQECVAKMHSDGEIRLGCIIDVYQGLNKTSSTPSSSSTTTPTTAATQNSVCGQVTPPQEAIAQVKNRAYCDRADGPGTLSQLSIARPWVDITADNAPSTVQVVSLSVYGVNPDHTVKPIGGSDAGKTAVTWSGLWSRSPWFPVGGGMIGSSSQTSSGAFNVPTNSVLHLGNEGGPVGSYIDFFAIGVFRTTGDAKIGVGVDGYGPNSNSTPIREIGTSDWFSCTTGTVTIISYNSSLSNPCTNTIGTMASTTTQTTAANCPATGIQITANSSLLSSCSSGLKVVTWDSTSNLISSSPGSPLYTMFTTPGFAHVTTMCGSSYRTSWPALGTNALNAGFSLVCSGGRDLTSSAIVCDDNGKPKLSVAINPNETGRCQ